MSKVKIFVDGLSQPARALMLFVRCAGIPFEEQKISIFQKQHKTEEYAKINPVQKIPAIEHEGFRLSESVAILRYLNRTYSVAPNWYPASDSKAIARIDEYMEWQHLNIRTHVSRYFASILMPHMLGLESADDTIISRMKKAMEDQFDNVEKVFLARGKFIAGDTITIADCLAIGELEQPKLVNYDVRLTRPKIGEYLERVRSELNPHYDDVHKVLHKFQKLRAEA